MRVMSVVGGGRRLRVFFFLSPTARGARPRCCLRPLQPGQPPLWGERRGEAHWGEAHTPDPTHRGRVDCAVARPRWRRHAAPRGEGPGRRRPVLAPCPPGRVGGERGRPARCGPGGGGGRHGGGRPAEGDAAEEGTHFVGGGLSFCLLHQTLPLQSHNHTRTARLSAPRLLAHSCPSRELSGPANAGRRRRRKKCSPRPPSPLSLRSTPSPQPPPPPLSPSLSSLFSRAPPHPTPPPPSAPPRPSLPLLPRPQLLRDPM